MRRERDFDNLGPILNDRKVCIRPDGGNNNKRARDDFEEYPDKIRYYSFPLEDGTRGYIRFIDDGKTLYVDFMSPWQDEKTPEALHYFASKAKGVREVVVTKSNAQDSLKPYLEDVRKIDFVQVKEGIRHTVYVGGEKESGKIK